jgi:hypothetical protein
MPLGYSNETSLVNLGDTAKLQAFLTDANDNILDATQVVSVTFNIQPPDGTIQTIPGVIQDDGSGYLAFNGTDQPGHYIAVATFTLFDGTIQSTKTNFEVQDPFNNYNRVPQSDLEFLAQQTWYKFSDMFDSADGGPWLREMTLNVFNPDSMTRFADEAVFDYNQFQPVTSFILDDFVGTTDYVNSPNPAYPVIVQANYLAIARHLMRSYIEQPDPRGGGQQITYEDRRDYLDRWKMMYEIEYDLYKRWVYISKRPLYAFGVTRTLVFSKSRASYFPGAPWRGRGWYPWP